MKPIYTINFKIFILLTAMLLTLPAVYAKRQNLITSPDQYSSNATQNSSEHPISNLYDRDSNSYWETDSVGDIQAEHYISVDLGNEIRLGSDEDLVVWLQRQPVDGRYNVAPTSFKVEVSADGYSWMPFSDIHKDTHIHFQFRGWNTKEYSERITTQRPFRYIKFTLKENLSHTYNSAGQYYMRLSEFHIIRLNRNDRYTYNRVDPFRAYNDYNDYYNDFTFEHTHGIIDERNRLNDTECLNWVADIKTWSDWSKWSTDGHWSDPRAAEAGVKMPDFTFITPTDSKYPIDDVRQRTHVIEHELYAIPGDVIPLYPFYELNATGAFYETFSHWYDYKTGGILKNDKGDNLLDFLINPRQIYRTDKNGYFAGSKMVGYGYAPKYNGLTQDEVFYIQTVDDFLDYASYSKEWGGVYSNVILESDLDFAGIKFEPIGSGYWFESSTFDGRGHTLYNINYETSGDYAGVFGKIAGSVIQNLIIDSSCHFKASSAAAVVASVYGDDALSIIKGVVNHGTMEVGTWNAGGIVGAVWGTRSIVQITDCGNTGTIIGPPSDGNRGDCGGIAGFLGTEAMTSTITNCWNTGNVSGNNSNGKFSASITNFINCYDIYGSNGLPVTPENVNTYDFANSLGGLWGIRDGKLLPYAPAITYNMDLPTLQESMNRTIGTVGTFYYPIDPYADDNNPGSLPDEYIIAADFSQKFHGDQNVDFANKKIIEPILVYRHLFHIKDGRTFAEKFSGSRQANEAYVKENMRIVTARAGVNFQVRLENAIPIVNNRGARSVYYYKAGENDYRRVGSSKIVVRNTDTGQEIDNTMFYFGNGFTAYGGRTYTNPTINSDYYRLGGCDVWYNRFIMWDNPVAGRYTVQVVGLDDNGNTINVYESDSPLIIQEFRLSFVPDPTAFVITAKELEENEKYAFAREENLVANMGQPQAKVDFDQYRVLIDEKSSNDYVYAREDNGRWVYQWRWPVPWEESSYGFGYNAYYDYSMYRISSHSLLVPYNGIPNNRPAEQNYGVGSGLYDRLFYKTKGKEQGFFYYTNAATDPGIMAVLKINDLCSGSTLNVSAYVSEFSGGETANISFNFVARLKEQYGNRRVVLHSFITGYVPAHVNNPEWYNVHYSFVPNFSELMLTTDMIDHYELELDNNCKNSGGADYAIDDIRVYVVRPEVTAAHITPMCRDDETTDVMIKTPFEVLLQTLGCEAALSDETAKDVDMFYTFIDKKKYDMARQAGKDGEDAYNEAVLKFDYMNNGDKTQSFGKLVFKTYYDSPSHIKYIDKRQSSQINTAMTLTEDGVKYIVFNARPGSDDLAAGKEYLLALYTNLPSDGIVVTHPTASHFDVEGECSKVSTFRLEASGTIKIDGITQPDLTSIVCCENQQPVVQIDLHGKEKPDGPLLGLVERNAFFDWYEGTRDDFDAEIENGIYLHDAIIRFRQYYPDSPTADVEPRNEFTAEMRDFVLKMSTPRDGKRAKLQLYKSSYVFPPLKFNEGEKETVVSVLAVPIDRMCDEYIMCAEPVDVPVRVMRRAPDLKHGLLGVEYPEYINDVPLRVGLRQLMSVSTSSANLPTFDKTLSIPVRTVTSTLPIIREMKMTDNRDVYLAVTNDPEYKHLRPVEGDPEDVNSGIVDIEGDGHGLMSVGQIKELNAEVDKSGQTGNVLRVAFDDSFKFKEGYYYSFVFNYEENLQTATGTIDPDDIPCAGDHVFTLKVVPEYMRWTGAGNNLNWHNDRNWSRVKAGDLKRAPEATDRFTSDGANSATFSYAPLDFTKVIIPEGDNSPWLYSVGEGDLKTVTVTDGAEEYSFRWPSRPEDPDPSSPAGAPQGSTDLTMDGLSTDVHYDMVARRVTTGIHVRPWYMHVCDQIHFTPGSRIFNQQYLTYNRAWVEMELAPARWYTLSSPLQGVIAGDMFLPKNGARQETELFCPINFSYGTHDRFAPAVYQRSWNKARATVYEIKDGPNRNVAIAANWSNVYNDVKEQYTAGQGYSIKTDVSRAVNPADKVLFRLPKDDVRYDYYSEDGTVIGNNTDVSTFRAEGVHGRLNPVSGTFSVEANRPGRYFLVGNPFMANMDMDKFFSGNAGVVNKKYWILTGDSQKAFIFDETTGGWVGSDGSMGEVAPMQGFFVETRDDLTSLTLSYDETMMGRDYSVGSNHKPLLSPRQYRSSDVQSMVISAVNADGDTTSSALLRVVSGANRDYDDTEDVMLMTDSEDKHGAMVYTLAGEYGTMINTVPSLDNVEIGFIHGEGETLSGLRFDHIAGVDGYMLYDTSTDEYHPIYEGMEYDMPETDGARLFITSGNKDVVYESIKVVIGDRGVRITTPNEYIKASVYDTLGRRVDGREVASHELDVSLDRGVYILDITDNVETRRVKVVIK
ncbi:MAG: discoidin domain-containing protein [Muribaculaceae bacterium]|nr:discoidin domain-containing protein [Muribaculaceae bacterium]